MILLFIPSAVALVFLKVQRLTTFRPFRDCFGSLLSLTPPRKEVMPFASASDRPPVFFQPPPVGFDRGRNPVVLNVFFWDLCNYIFHGLRMSFPQWKRIRIR